MDGIGSPDLVSVLWSFSSPAMPARPPSHIKLFLWRRLTVLVVRIKRHLVEEPDRDLRLGGLARFETLSWASLVARSEASDDGVRKTRCSSSFV